VILSQLFRGFSKGLDSLKNANKEEFACACLKASDMAYRAVMKPKEGTILTMARELANNIFENKSNNDLEKIIMDVIDYGKKVLKETTDMLPQLKQAGVVDSGATGLLYIFIGAAKVMNNSINIDIDFIKKDKENKNNKAQENFNTQDINFGYCTELFIEPKKNISNSQKELLRKKLSEIGDSLILISDYNLIKIHVHTNNPGLVLENALELGMISNIKIDNLKLQHRHIIDSDNNKTNKIKYESEEVKENIFKKAGFISVVMGNGFCELFKNLGADIIIEGGQTMNPSIEDISLAIKKINAEEIFILPNNKNIILAAEQAAKIYEDKKVFVLETKTMPQGLTAMMNYSVNNKNNLELIKKSISLIKTGKITYAVRDTKFDNKKINKGDILCLLEDNIIFVEKDINIAVKKLIDFMLENKNDGEILSIYYGKDINKNSADKIFDYAKEKYENIDIEIFYGEQALYYYIISLE
jgi:DAK2 domain fusion protein YloV